MIQKKNISEKKRTQWSSRFTLASVKRFYILHLYIFIPKVPSVRRFLGEKKRKNCGSMYFSRRMQWDNLQKSDFFQLLSDLAISRVCKIQKCTNAAQFTHMSSYSVYHSKYCHNRVILAVYSECVYTVWGHISDIIRILTGQNTMNYTYTCHHIVYYTEYH